MGCIFPLGDSSLGILYHHLGYGFGYLGTPNLGFDYLGSGFHYLGSDYLGSGYPGFGYLGFGNLGFGFLLSLGASVITFFCYFTVNIRFSEPILQ